MIFRLENRTQRDPGNKYGCGNTERKRKLRDKEAGEGDSQLKGLTKLVSWRLVGRKLGVVRLEGIEKSSGHPPKKFAHEGGLLYPMAGGCTPRLVDVRNGRQRCRGSDVVTNAGY